MPTEAVFKGFLLQPGDNYSPAYSPDGTQIVYVSDQTGQDEIWVMQFDGILPKQLTFNSPTGNWAPRWSQDGHYIIWVSQLQDGSTLEIMNSDGSNQYTYGPFIPAGGVDQSSGVAIDTTRCRPLDSL
jgi:Tol biopolymer transport system component